VYTSSPIGSDIETIWLRQLYINSFTCLLPSYKMIILIVEEQCVGLLRARSPNSLIRKETCFGLAPLWSGTSGAYTRIFRWMSGLPRGIYHDNHIPRCWGRF
jgi:hypothetical protein